MKTRRALIHFICGGVKAFAVIVLVAGVVRLAHGATELDSKLRDVTFEQKLGQQVSLSIPFQDERGRHVTLGDYFQNKPVILVPGYYECRMLCHAVTTGLTNGLRDLPLNPGRDFVVVSFTIDPRESADIASRRKSAVLSGYRHADAEGNWHFLTGNESSIRKLTEEIGFHYFYDPDSKQYAHSSGIVVLTPAGKISQYLFGVNFSAPDLHRAISTAKDAKAGSLIKQLLLLCFHYQPVTGRYSLTALSILRGLAALFAGGLAGGIVLAVRTERLRNSKSRS